MKTLSLGWFAPFVFIMPAAFANSGSYFLVNKQANYVQSSTSAPVASGTIGLESYSMSFQTPAAATVTPPGLTAVNIPYNTQNSDYELDPAFATKASMDAAYPDGTYTFSATGYPSATVALTPDLYPSVVPTITNGTWQNNALVVTNPALATTITFNTFSGYNSTTNGQVAGAESFQLGSSTSGDSVNLKQQYGTVNVAGFTVSSTPFTSFTIPAGTLTAGLVYQASLQFDSIAYLNTTSLAPNVEVGFFQNQTQFYVVAPGNGSAAAPVITQQPVNVTGPLGSTVQFFANFTPVQQQNSTTQAYQTFAVWYVNGQSINPDGVKYIAGPNGDLTITSLASSDLGTYVLEVFNSSGLAVSNPVTLAVGQSSGPPTITTQPSPDTGVLNVAGNNGGTTTVLTIAASNATNYQWLLNGSPILQGNVSGANGPILVITSATPSNAGNYSCKVSNSAGSVNSNAVNINPTASTNPGRLGNLSVLNSAGSTQILTVGFITGGAGTSGSQNLLIRASGPALAAFSVPNPLPDPKLTVIPLGQTTSVAANDNWDTPTTNGDAVMAADNATGAFGLTNKASLDAALVTQLPAGPYTAQITGNTAGVGAVLAEVYDDTPAGTYTITTPRLVNLSSTTQISAGGSLVAGFVIGGTTAKTVLIRATGPTLTTSYGVQGTIPDPKLTLHATINGQDTILATNAGWGGSAQIAAVTSSVGAFALASPSSLDSVILTTLPPGNYTAVGTSVSGTAGTVLVEVYEVP